MFMGERMAPLFGGKFVNLISDLDKKGGPTSNPSTYQYTYDFGVCQYR